MTREEKEHYEKLAEYYNAKQKPKTDTWSIKEVAKALEKHGFGRLEQEQKTDVLDKIRAEIKALNNIDYVKPITVDEILQIIDKYTNYPLGYNPWQE